MNEFEIMPSDEQINLMNKEYNELQRRKDCCAKTAKELFRHHNIILSAYAKVLSVELTQGKLNFLKEFILQSKT